MAPMIIESEHFGNLFEFENIAKVDTDGKRKAAEEPDVPSANKRFKESHSHSPDTEKRPVKVVPFPEKVGSPYHTVPLFLLVTDVVAQIARCR